MDRRHFMKATLYGFSLAPSKILAKPILNDRQDENTSVPRKRIRELGIKLGIMEPGLYNAITDVEGVRVGHTTIIKGEGKGATRTGVTVILPHSGNIHDENLFASYFNLNGWGEITGIAPLVMTGKLKTPIFLTGTYNVGIVYDAATKYFLKNHLDPDGSEEIFHPIVAECFDDFLSDTQSRQISEEDVFRALEKAKSGPVEEGVVGGGTGMTSFGFKGGIGTSSRKIGEQYTVGVLVMANTGSRNELRIDGVPVGKEIQGFEYKSRKTKSIILVAATDAPLLPFQLKKMAKRVAMGLAQTGAISHTGSGDIIMAFSTANKIPKNRSHPYLKIKSLSDFWITPIYQATVEATHEAIVNAITTARTITGRNGNTAYGLPLDQVKDIMRKYLSIRARNHE